MSRLQSSRSAPPPLETAVPTLRVMRLQSPELHSSNTALCGSSIQQQCCALQTALCLPDSLTVYVGEYFTAYLGVLNASKNVPIRRLTVTAQLQTPSHRFQLPSATLDQGNLSGGMDVAAESSVDAIVSRVIEESGQHILRVEVGYLTAEGGTKTFRKFYRFQVLSPVTLKESVVRLGDTRCLITVSVEYPKLEKEKQDLLMIASINLEAASGLEATNVGCTSSFHKTTTTTKNDNDTSTTALPLTAVQLFDAAGSMVPGGSFRYIFAVEAASNDAMLRGIAAGDYLGRSVVTWRKAMGETGTVYSNGAGIHCPKADPVFDRVVPTITTTTTVVGDQLQRQNNQPQQRLTCSNFVVHRSGFTVDAAAAAAGREPHNFVSAVTVEPIDPPARVPLNVPVRVQFLVVNHSDRALTLQLQFALSHMDPGLVVTGPSFKNLGDVPPHGGSTVTLVCFLPLKAGLVRVEGCSVVDLASGREMVQPPLFITFVEQQQQITHDSAGNDVVEEDMDAIAVV